MRATTPAPGAPADTVRVAIAGAIPASARQGLVMSLEESARVAALLGRAIVLDSGIAGVERAAFVIAGSPPALSPSTRGIVLDVGCTAPSPPAPEPARAGEPRRIDARRFSLCTGAARDLSTRDSVVDWDAALEKFGASQLNDRFRARWGSPMSADAWRGWLAAKIAWESALRAPRGPSARARWLASPAARFDGHQGVPLSFDARHRLRHPRYRVLHRDGVRTLEQLP